MPEALPILVHDPSGSIKLGAVARRFRVHAFRVFSEALAALNHLGPAAVVLALTEEGIEGCETISARQPGLPVLFLQRDGALQVEMMLAAMRAGARDVVDARPKGWQSVLSRRLESGLAWRQALDRGQDVRMAALRAIAERSQDDQVALEIKLTTLQEQLDAERAVVEQTQSRLEIQRGLAMSAVRAKATLLANISHEFNTPLNAIVGYGELIREQLEQSQDVDRIISTAQHLTGLVQAVLNLARLESGDIHPVFETIAVNELLARTVAKVSSKARDSRVELLIEPYSVDTVVTDPLRLQETLHHILDNAIKFSPGGRITVEVLEQNEETEFVISDTGIGMEKRTLDSVFSAFTQADDGDTRAHGGTGLGLAIANQTARVIGGRITARSTPGQGSRFAVVIPNVIAGMQSSNLDRELTVLIVDDDPVLRKVLERMLVADGHAALTTGEPTEAVALAREHQPSLIALDVMLPGIDGWTLLHELTNDPTVRGIPVVIISATDQSERALEEGARAFLDKPIDRDALRGVIRKHAPQPHRVLVLADHVPAYLEPLDNQHFSFRPCRVDELADALPSRAATVLFPLDVDPTEAVRALRLLKSRSEIRCIAVGDVSGPEQTFLAARFHGVVSTSEVAPLLRESSDN